MFDVLALGELLVDFTVSGLSTQGNPTYEANPGADMLLTADEIPEDAIANSRIFHFGTLSMTHESIRAATKKAVAIAKANSAIVSFDPNFRPPLWANPEDAREQIA